MKYNENGSLVEMFCEISAVESVHPIRVTNNTKKVGSNMRSFESDQGHFCYEIFSLIHDWRAKLFALDKYASRL